MKFHEISGAEISVRDFTPSILAVIVNNLPILDNHAPTLLASLKEIVTTQGSTA